MKINFKVNGKDVASGKLDEAIQDAAFIKVREQIAQKLSGIRCQEHNQAPRAESPGLPCRR